MNDKWLISLDLDGTSVIDRNLTIEEYDDKGRRLNFAHQLTKDAIKALQEDGHIVIINTGRNWYSTEPAYKELGVNSYVSLSAGARIYNPITKEEIINDISKDIIEEIINDPLVIDNIVHVISEDGEEVSLIEVDDSRKDVIDKLRHWWTINISSELKDIKDTASCRITTKLDYEDNQVLLNKLIDKYSRYIDFTTWQGYNFAGINGITFNNAEWSKGKALLYLAESNGIRKENTMAFGDDENDITMFKLAGESVALINAKDKAKEHAKHITKVDNNNGGVGLFLKEWFNLDI